VDVGLRRSRCCDCRLSLKADQDGRRFWGGSVIGTAAEMRPRAAAAARKRVGGPRPPRHNSGGERHHPQGPSGTLRVRTRDRPTRQAGVARRPTQRNAPRRLDQSLSRRGGGGGDHDLALFSTNRVRNRRQAPVAACPMAEVFAGTATPPGFLGRGPRQATGLPTGFTKSFTQELIADGRIQGRSELRRPS